jgi:hypothetical protein
MLVKGMDDPALTLSFVAYFTCVELWEKNGCLFFSLVVTEDT